LSDEMTLKLLTQCHKAYGTDANDILVSSLTLALKEIFGLDVIRVHMEGHGHEQLRPDIDVSRTIGWFTTEYPINIDTRFSDDIIRHLIEVKETLHRVPANGIGYGILRYLKNSHYSSTPQVTFNYFGDFGSGIADWKSKPLFKFSDLFKGDEVSLRRDRETILEVSGIVLDNKLHVTITYSNKQYSDFRLNEVAESYHQKIETLIGLLSSEEDKHVTPVDFTYQGLSMEQLQELNKTL
jgi:non-ribosomal peptide synthase protein (TIGR01720 family)